MNRDRSRRLDCSDRWAGSVGNGDGGRFLLRGEEQILQSIGAGLPLPELLNRICSALDCEIANVVSLISLLNEDTAGSAAMGENAKHFGLHMLCTIGIIAENQELLGTLEIYACEPWDLSSRELDLIKRAGRLAAIAIEIGKGTLEDENVMAAEMWPIRKQTPNSPEILN
jgi:hypothetical protein